MSMELFLPGVCGFVAVCMIDDCMKCASDCVQAHTWSGRIVYRCVYKGVGVPELWPWDCGRVYVYPWY